MKVQITNVYAKKQILKAATCFSLINVNANKIEI